MGKLEERKTQKIDDSSNNHRASTQKSSTTMVFQQNFLKNMEKYLCRSRLVNKVSGLLQHRYYCPVNLAKILRTLFLENTPGGYMLPNLKRRRTKLTHNLEMNRKQSKTVTWNYSNYSYSRMKKLSKEEKM